MKIATLIAIIAVVISCAICCTGNQLSVLNLDYIQPTSGTKVHNAFKYANMTMKFHVMTETDPDDTVFKFIWNYSSEDEKTKGHQLLEQLKGDFEEIREDNGFLIVFLGRHINKLKFYKKTEFGSAYTIEINQKGVAVQLQFQIKRGEENEDEFHTAIEKVIEKREQKQVLEFLS